MEDVRVLSQQEVIHRVGIGRVTIWRLEKEGNFPLRIRLTDHRIGWYEHEITQWIESRPRMN